jgi:hypothetical protein
MQAPGLYGAYGAPSTIYNAYSHASSIYQQAAQPPWMMQPPGGVYYGYGGYSQGLPPPHHHFGDYSSPNYYSGYPLPRQHSSYHHQSEPSSLAKSMTIRSRSTTAERVSPSKLRSSPIQASLEDTMQLLLEYFDYQTRRNPSEVKDIEYAYERLFNERYSLEQILAVS